MDGSVRITVSLFLLEVCQRRALSFHAGIGGVLLPGPAGQGNGGGHTIAGLVWRGLVFQPLEVPFREDTERTRRPFILDSDCCVCGTAISCLERRALRQRAPLPAASSRSDDTPGRNQIPRVDDMADGL